jgi:nicotinate-nucleotide adenylyltransferase
MSDYLRDYYEFSSLESRCIASRQNRVGLLGGTFNPVHNGHISMAAIALYEFLLGEVIFLPLGMPPHKRGECIASAQQRLEMVRLAIAAENRFSVSTIETNRNGYTYTVDTLEMLSRARKETDFYYIIGADTLLELTSWKNYKRVLLLTDFICIMRPGLDDAKVRQCADDLNRRFGHKIHFASERGLNISSTHIRMVTAQGGSLSGLVPDTVARYIYEHGLYRTEV